MTIDNSNYNNLRFYTILCLTLMTPILLLGQLKVFEINDSEDIINELLGENEDITISNMKLYGQLESFGLYNCPLYYNELPKEGIIMSTGNINNAIGPNNDTRKSSKVNHNCDEDIFKIAKKTCYDTALIEFDLVSETDEIQFNYFFASEEYPEFINKNVNDVFIFLVTNLMDNTSENIAVLNHETKTPITVDHVNHEFNSEYYLKSVLWSEENRKKYHDSLNVLELSYTFQFDGFTKMLTAKAKVIPHVTYRFKLGISDIGDQYYDSAIFLQANSLKSVGNTLDITSTIEKIGSELSIDYDINFETASVVIEGEESFKLLANVFEELQKNKNLIITIIGHTDKNGSATYNNELSYRRAESVKNYFLTKGIAAHRISTLGKGASEPKSASFADNRRVEIIFTTVN